MENKKPREQWSGRLGFVLATAGSAVGLGNIMKFPWMTGQNGGAAFLFVYIVVMLIIGIGMLLGMIACTCAAYPLSKKRLKGRTFFTFLLMFPMYFSAGLIPNYLLLKNLHLLNNM